MSVNNEGKKILKDAISLKQIIYFYNTLSSKLKTKVSKMY